MQAQAADDDLVHHDVRARVEQQIASMQLELSLVVAERDDLLFSLRKGNGDKDCCCSVDHSAALNTR